MPHNTVMPVGKHRGEFLVDLPSNYLYWVAENFDDDEIATKADEEYRRRSDENDHFYE